MATVMTYTVEKVGSFKGKNEEPKWPRERGGAAMHEMEEGVVSE